MRTKKCEVQEQGYRYEIDIFWSNEDGCFIAWHRIRPTSQKVRSPN